jgi:DHA1 family inner membrane transport protein
VTPGHGRDLAVLTGAKTVSNTALRWIGVFLPTLERAFGASTGTLTSVMGVAELGGLTTTATGHWLDRGHERRLFIAGMTGVVASSLIALGGRTWTFGVAYAVLIIGVGNLTVAGHAWIGHRYRFTARGRAIGTFELSWAISLLVGAPLVALLIRGFGWRGPFVALGITAALGAVVVNRRVTAGAPTRRDPAATRVRLGASAYPPMIASAATAAAGFGLFVVSGAWLDDDHGVSTGGLGVIAAAYGAVELVSSSGVALVSDRFGSRRSVIAGLLLLLGGCALVATAGDSRAMAIAGLLVFLAGFEYAFVSSLTLVTEAAPEARGRAVGTSNAIGTLARAGSVVIAGQLYEAVGIEGTVAWVAGAALLALVMTMLSRTAVRPAPETR